MGARKIDYSIAYGELCELCAYRGNKLLAIWSVEAPDDEDANHYDDDLSGEWIPQSRY